MLFVLIIVQVSALLVVLVNAVTLARVDAVPPARVDVEIRVQAIAVVVAAQHARAAVDLLAQVHVLGPQQGNATHVPCPVRNTAAMGVKTPVQEIVIQPVTIVVEDCASQIVHMSAMVRIVALYVQEHVPVHVVQHVL